MKIEIQDVSTTRKNMVVSLDQAEVAAEYTAVVSEFVQQARLPGFRPGKAPAAMIERQFAKQISAEFQQKVTAKAYRDGLKDSKLDVITITDVQPGTITKDAAANITITIDVRPEFALPDYNEIPTAIEPVEATDAQVDAMIDQLRAERADFKVSEAPAQKGDFVKLAYEGTIDGASMEEIVGDKKIYAKVPQTWEEVEGENEGLIPGLGKHLSGVKAGDKKTVEATYPAEFTAVPALAGKTASYAVEVQEIRTRELPALDEAFFKAQQVDNLDALKARVREQLQGRKEYQNRQAQRRQITEALNNRVEFEVPATLVEEETQNVLRNFIEENMRRGVPEEQFEMDKKELFENAKKAALTRVKTRLILGKIAEQEKISVDEKDIDAFLYREAMMSGSRPDKLVKEISKDRDRLRAVQQSIILDKALELIVSKAKVTTVEAKA